MRLELAVWAQYLLDRQIELEWAARLLPSVVARMSSEIDLIKEIRPHPNVDYLEPIFPGEFLESGATHVQ